MEKNYRIMFIRGSNNHPVGCLALKFNNGSVDYQVSTLNPVDRFNRPVARQLALGRLLEAPITITTNNSNIHDVVRSVMNHVINNKTVPNRTRKAAANWMRNANNLKLEAV